jgi:nucleotide-binding universal stress UspA family protein
MFKKILIATDGSALSDKAVQAAMTFAAGQSATVVGLSVAEIYPFMLMPEAGAMVVDLRRTARQVCAASD